MSDIDLTVRSSVVGGWTVLSVEGEVDLYTAPAVRDAALAAIESGVDHLVLDLTAVPFMDSSGLGVLVTVLKEAREMGGTLRLINPQESIARLLRITGMADVFTAATE